jgi:DnaJ family protein C protein 13
VQSPSLHEGHAASEEPEYLCRYLVTKHSWRGKYRRILCISQTSIITLDPTTLTVTNSYDVLSDFETAAPVVGKDDPHIHYAQEFIINVRTDGRGKFKAMKFSSRFLLPNYICFLVLVNVVFG